jgi:hypothetical protein
MITIRKGELNTIIMRLKEFNYYKFEFKSIQSGDIVKCIPQNQSTISNYNKFEIKDLDNSTATQSPTASIPEINLRYSGSWEYKIFGLENLDLDEEGILLDFGSTYVIGPETESFFFEEETINYPIFYDIEDLYYFSFDDDVVNGVFEDDFSNWILRNGFWRDAGVWIDTAFWRD